MYGVSNITGMSRKRSQFTMWRNPFLPKWPLPMEACRSRWQPNGPTTILIPTITIPTSTHNYNLKNYVCSKHICWRLQETGTDDKLTFRIIQMDTDQVSKSDDSFKFFEKWLESVRINQIVTRCQRMASIKANSYAGLVENQPDNIRQFR